MRTLLLERHNSEKGRKTVDRMKVVLWVDEGWRFRQIAHVLFVDEQIVRCYLNEYQQFKDQSPDIDVILFNDEIGAIMATKFSDG